VRRLGIRTFAAAAACAAALAGCGGTSSGDSAGEQAAQAYVDAHNQRDFSKLCSLLSDQLRRRLGGEDCAQTIEGQTQGPIPAMKLVSVQGSADRAVASVQTSSAGGDPPQNLKLVFEHSGGNWELTGF